MRSVFLCASGSAWVCCMLLTGCVHVLIHVFPVHSMCGTLFADSCHYTPAACLLHTLHSWLRSRLCCRVLVMDKGTALEYGRPAELLEREEGAFTGRVWGAGGHICW